MPTTQQRQRTRNSATENIQQSAQTNPVADPQTAPTAVAGERLQEATSARAYELYLSRGAEDGHDLDDWLQAETEIRQRARSES